MLTLKNVRKLRVKNNVSYLVKGNNIHLENGKEVFNKITHNLIISPINSYFLYYSEHEVNGIYITHPRNNVSYNHVVGS